MTKLAAATGTTSGGSGLFDDGFGWGGVLLVIGMVAALAIVSGLGIFARMRDRATEPPTHAAAGGSTAAVDSPPSNATHDDEPGFDGRTSASRTA